MMEDREKIKQMLKEGKINSDQATLLIQALKESEQRKAKIFQQVAAQKNRREQRAYGFLTWWLGLILASICLLMIIGSTQRLDRNVKKALLEFHQANVHLEKEEYTQALEYLHKGIQKAPHFPLGYSLSGLTYRIIFEKIGDSTYQQKSEQAFKKAVELTADGRRREMMGSTGFIFLFIVFVLILSVVSIVLLAIYNILVKREERVYEAWAQIAALHQRKVDLIPALLETVKKATSHEKETLETITQLRTHAQDITQQAGDKTGDIEKLEESHHTLEKSMAQIQVLAEKYPELKTSVNFLTIQQQLAETEDKIAEARQAYNLQVNHYNTSLRLFPFNLMAVMFQFPIKEYFKAESVI
jgi:LemA protein